MDEPRYSPCRVIPGIASPPPEPAALASASASASASPARTRPKRPAPPAAAAALPQQKRGRARPRAGADGGGGGASGATGTSTNPLNGAVEGDRSAPPSPSAGEQQQPFSPQKEPTHTTAPSLPVPVPVSGQHHDEQNQDNDNRDGNGNRDNRDNSGNRDNDRDNRDSGINGEHSDNRGNDNRDGKDNNTNNVERGENRDEGKADRAIPDTTRRKRGRPSQRGQERGRGRGGGQGRARARARKTKPPPAHDDHAEHTDQDSDRDDGDGDDGGDDDYTTPRKRTRTSPEAPPEIAPGPARRSTRARAPPRDPYLEAQTLATAKKQQQQQPQRQAGRAASSTPRKKRKAEELWAPKNLTTKNSPFVTADLSVLTRQNIGDAAYDSLIALLPAEDIVYPVASPPPADLLAMVDPKPQINPAVFDSVFFKQGVRNYQMDLSCGKYEADYIARGAAARKRRMAGHFDRWKDAQFELHWGDNQRVYHDAVAGDSCKVRLAELIRHHQFRLGDVFSMRRSFARGLTVRKDAVLTAMKAEDGSMDFTYPPGTAEWTRAGVPDKTVTGVVSLTALETLLLREDARAPEKLPNGNAFKTIRVVRRGEDIGCVFDVRAKFWAQYLKDRGNDEDE